MNDIGNTFIQDTLGVFRQHKDWADQALAQLKDDQAYFRALGPRSHSIAINVKHVAGNLRSRWSSFLTTDGEKPDRNRDQEFEITSQDSRVKLKADWDTAWQILCNELSALKPDDLTRIITIRGEPHTVIRAIQRSLAHAAYHTGQILYLCRLLKEGDWRWLTIAPGQSRTFNETMQSKTKP